MVKLLASESRTTCVRVFTSTGLVFSYKKQNWLNKQGCKTIIVMPGVFWGCVDATHIDSAHPEMAFFIQCKFIKTHTAFRLIIMSIGV